jgi:hypothetical protein
MVRRSALRDAQQVLPAQHKRTVVETSLRLLAKAAVPPRPVVCSRLPPVVTGSASSTAPPAKDARQSGRLGNIRIGIHGSMGKQIPRYSFAVSWLWQASHRGGCRGERVTERAEKAKGSA